MTTAEVNTLTQLCKLERTQFLTILPHSQTNPCMTGFLLPGNRSNFVHFDGASIWAYEYQHHLSTLYTHKEKCFDKIPFLYYDTLYYVDPISRQNYSFATQIRCDGNLASNNAFDPNGSEFYLLTPARIKQDSLGSF